MNKNFAILFIFEEIYIKKCLYTRQELADRLACSCRTLTNYIQEVNAYLFNNFVYKSIKVVDGYYKIINI